MSDKKRFVIQRHQRQDQGIHWDLMLESLNDLETYRLDSPPEQIRGNGKNRAEKIFGHDKKFLSYEGLVNKGKGMVKIVEAGTFQWLESSEQKSIFKFEGAALKGVYEMVHVDGNVYSFDYVRD